MIRLVIMAKNKKTFTSSLPAQSKTRKIFIAIFILVLIVVGLIGFRKYQYKADKEKFIEARAVIDDIYAKTVNEFGEPNNFERSSECSKGYINSYDQVISCGVHTELIYGVNNRQTADVISNKIRQIINESNNFRSTSKPYSIAVNPAPGDPDNRELIDYYSGPGKIACTFKYVYDWPENTHLKLLQPIQGKVFYIIAGCNGNARELYFPTNY